LDFFNQNNPRFDAGKLARLKISDFFYNGVFKTRDNIIQDSGCNFNLITFFRLRSTVLQFVANFKVSKDSDGSATGIDSFFNQDRKGSKHVRKIINNLRLKDRSITINYGQISF
jgi:hypothetical protein